MLFVTNCEVNKNLSLYSNSSQIECAAKTSAGLFSPGGTPAAPRRHPSGTPAASSDTRRHHGDTPATPSYTQLHPAAPRRHPATPQRHPGDKPGKTGTPKQHELLRLCEKPLHALQVTVSIFLKNCELYHRSMYCESKLNSYLGGNRPQCERSANPNSH